MIAQVTLGDLIHHAPVKRAGNSDYTVLSMTRAGGLVPQDSVFTKVIASRNLASYKVVRPNQLVVGIHVDEGALGFSGPEQVGVVSPAYTLWDLRSPNAVHTPYLHRFIRSETAVSYFLSKYRETAERRGKLTHEHFLALKVPLPPLSEQRRIAAILDKADELRAKRRAALATLDTLTQSIFLDMFGDPVTNPKGWPKKPFGQVCETRLGKMLDQKQQTGKHRRPYLRNANVQWFRFELTDVFEMDFDEDDRRILKLQPGDLLICEGGEPGRAAVWQGELDECYFQKALHRARPDKNLAIAGYICWLLWFLAQRKKLTGVTSATIAHLTGEKLAVLPILLPPRELQLKFTEILRSTQAVARDLLAGLRNLDALFCSLQYRAFRGEL